MKSPRVFFSYFIIRNGAIYCNYGLWRSALPFSVVQAFQPDSGTLGLQFIRLERPTYAIRHRHFSGSLCINGLARF